MNLERGRLRLSHARRVLEIGLLVLLGCFAPTPSRSWATPLGDLATSMQPGTWAALPTSNALAALGANGASGSALGFADDLSWDPTSRQVFFIGSDHGDAAQFVGFSESTNAWQRLPRPSWLPNTTMHGYSHTAINEATGQLYHRPYNENRVHRYNIASGTWTTLPSPPFTNTACCESIKWFPELGGLVWVRAFGDVWLFRETTSQWSQVGAVPCCGTTWQAAEYNPVHKVLVFWLGNRLYRVSSTGQITQLRAPPTELYNGSGITGVFTVDPVSGDYLVISPPSREFYSYNVVTDTWQQRSNPPSTFSDTFVVATPVRTYGVTFFTSCSRAACNVTIYKHAASSPQPSPNAPTGLVAQ